MCPAWGLNLKLCHQAGGRSAKILHKGPGFTENICEFSMDVVPSTDHIPIGSMYAIYGNIWGILMVNVTIYGIHGSYGI